MLERLTPDSETPELHTGDVAVLDSGGYTDWSTHLLHRDPPRRIVNRL
ncbi:hypothetical protein ACIBF6_13390 [Streptosporangium amethystogenes]